MRHIRPTFIVAALAAATFFAMPASAQVTNGGFESGGGSYSGWTVVGDTTIQTSSLGTGPTEGTHDALLASQTDGSVNNSVPPGTGVGPSSLESALGVNSGTLQAIGNGTPLLGSVTVQQISVVAGQHILFDWDFLTNQVYNDGTPDSYAPRSDNNDFAFFTLTPVGSPGSAHVGKLADTFYGFVANSGAPGGFQTGFTITPVTNPFISETGFQTMDYAPAASGNYILGMGVVHASTGIDDGINSAVLVDNVRLTTVPEPATCSLLAALCGGALLRRRRGAKR